MQMKPEHAERLVGLVVLPHLSPRSRLIVVRRLARESNARWVDTRAFFDEQIKHFKAGLPFTASQLARVNDLRKQARADHRRMQHELGQWLRENDALLTGLYGFAGVFDLLEVSPVHRAEVMEYKDDGRAISSAAFIGGMEESASRQSGRKPEDWKDGPLFHVYMAMMTKFMLDNPGALPDPTAPGGPLEGIPTYTQQPDGSMLRNTPVLQVHDAVGAKTIDRRPGKRRSVPATGASVSNITTNMTRQEE
jgi:hypothetical protein